MPGRTRTAQWSIQNVLADGLQTFFKWPDKEKELVSVCPAATPSPGDFFSPPANAGVAAGGPGGGCQGRGMQGRAVDEGSGAQRGCKGLGHQDELFLHGVPPW